MHPQTPQKILVVEDDPSARAFFERLLKVSGYEVALAMNGDEATRVIGQETFDAILSDINMPGMNGIALLESVRKRDFDVPVILVTGSPNVDTAAKAVQHGAFRYLVKPVDSSELLSSISYATEVGKVARAKRQVLKTMGRAGASDLAGLEAAFARALPKIWMAYQPIVSATSRCVYAHEALLRSDDQALPHVGALLDAAERLGRLHDLGRAVRRLVAEAIARSQDDMHFFVNLHPHDLGDDDLYDASAPLSRFAHRVVLEITERAHIDDVSSQLDKLRALGFRIALDDLGAGYAGLNTFVRLRPDVVKIDMELVRGVATDNTRSQLVRSVIELGRALTIPVVAEGIEDKKDLATLLTLGVDLLQGYIFAKPARVLTVISPAAFDAAAA